jgi:hypothetical protein
MPNITLTWSTRLYVPASVQYGDNDWIYNVQWRYGETNAQLSTGSGLYIVQNAAGNPIYASQAGNLRSRFQSRSDVLQDLGIAREATALAHRADMATVNPSAQLNLAELWLVRTLYVADHPNMVHILQNVQLTGQFQAPADGLDVANNNRPAYINGNYAYDGGENI